MSTDITPATEKTPADATETAGGSRIYHPLNDRFFAAGGRRRHFGVSTQHYSFAVQAFARMVRSYDTASYDFAIRETRTQAVIEDVASLTSEIGILYLSDFNRAILTKMFEAKAVEFHPLTQCQAYVYLSRNHPLATLPGISFQQLKDDPCLSFEQGGSGSFYFAEEILTTKEYPPHDSYHRPCHQPEPDGGSEGLHPLLGGRL